MTGCCSVIIGSDIPRPDVENCSACCLGGPLQTSQGPGAPWSLISDSPIERSHLKLEQPSGRPGHEFCQMEIQVYDFLEAVFQSKQAWTWSYCRPRSCNRSTLWFTCWEVVYWRAQFQCGDGVSLVLLLVLILAEFSTLHSWHSTSTALVCAEEAQLSWPTLRSVYVFQWQGTRWITRVLWGSQYSPVTSFNVTCCQFQSSKALLVCCFFFVVVSLMSSEKITVTIFKIYFCSTLIDVSLHWQLGSGSLCNWDNILNKEGESIAGAYQELRCVSQLTKQTKLNYIQHNRYSDVFWEWW